MLRKRKCRRQRCKLLQQHLRSTQVSLHLRGRSSAFSRFAFRDCSNSMRPLCRPPKSHPFHPATGKPVTAGRCLSLTHCPLQRIAQVADHLANAHPAPSPLARRSNCGQPPQNLRFVRRILQCLHAPSR
jgi:hypothetical protein